MLDAFVKLLDSVIKLVDLRQKNRREYFDQYVQPTFELAEAVYKDYRLLLRGLREMVRGGESVARIIDFLDARREELLPIRRRLSAFVARRAREGRAVEFEAGILGLLSGASSALHDRHLIEYVYEPTTRSLQQRTGSHTVLDLLQFLKEHSGRDIPGFKQRLLRAVDEQQGAIDQAWQSVLRGYADLHATRLPAPRVVRDRKQSRQEAIESIRVNVEKVRRMIATRKFARNPVIDLERAVAVAAPEALDLALDLRGVTHDLDHGEPNVTVTDLKKSLARFEIAMSRMGISHGHRGRRSNRRPE